MKEYSKKQFESKIAKWTKRLEDCKEEPVYEYQWMKNGNVFSLSYFGIVGKGFDIHDGSALEIDEGGLYQPILETRRIRQCNK